MDLSLKGRVAVITGGAAGIGEAIARALAVEGCVVTILDRDVSAAAKTAASLAQHGLQANSIAVDVGNNTEVIEVFRQIVTERNQLDILINSAGLLSTGLVADLPADEWDRVSRVNVAGILHCVKAAEPIMAQRRYGRIVNVASVSAMRGGGSVGNALYGATKAAVVALTMGLARELGPFGITVNAVAPAVVDTAMTRATLTDDVRQKILARIPLGRLATLADVADLTAFLVSDRASFITGAIIPVDGGILTT